MYFDIFRIKIINVRQKRMINAHCDVSEFVVTNKRQCFTKEASLCCNFP